MYNFKEAEVKKASGGPRISCKSQNRFSLLGVQPKNLCHHQCRACSTMTADGCECVCMHIEENNFWLMVGCQQEQQRSTNTKQNIQETEMQKLHNIKLFSLMKFASICLTNLENQLLMKRWLLYHASSEAIRVWDSFSSRGLESLPVLP